MKDIKRHYNNISSNKDRYQRVLRENRELKEWKRKLSLILKYSSRINTTKDVKKVVKIITDSTNKILNSDRCTVFLLDKEKNELYSWLAHGINGEEIRFPADKGIAGYVASFGETVNVKDAYNDERFNKEIDKQTGYKTETLLCMPMKNQPGEIIGVFQVLNKKDGVFTAQDEEILGLISQQASSAIESAFLYEEIKKSFTSFINTLAETIDARDPLTAGHSRRVCEYSVLLAKSMGFNPEKIEVIKYAALLHDLGKVGVKEEVLTKPGRLNGEEYNHIQTHTSITRKILEQTYFQHKFKDIPKVASSHHEHIDGTGYPNKLKGNHVPIMSRILAVADVFDALTYERHYRGPLPFEEVISILKKRKGTKFDQRCVDKFLAQNTYDVLKILTHGAKNYIKNNEEDEFKQISIDEIAERIRNNSTDPLVEKFCQYYPARF